MPISENNASENNITETTFSLLVPTKPHPSTEEPITLMVTLHNPGEVWQYYDLHCVDVPHVVLQSDRPRIALSPQSTREVSITLMYQSETKKRAKHWPPTPFACTLQPLIPLTGEHTGEPYVLSTHLCPTNPRSKIGGPVAVLGIAMVLASVAVAGQRGGWWQLQNADATPVAIATPLDTQKDDPQIPEIILPFQTVLQEKNYDTLVSLTDTILEKEPNNSVARDLKAYAAISKNPTENKTYVRELLDKTGTRLSDLSRPEIRAVHVSAEWAYYHALGDTAQADALQKRAQEIDRPVADALIVP
jgi:hypothetical protein